MSLGLGGKKVEQRMGGNGRLDPCLDVLRPEGGCRLDDFHAVGGAAARFGGHDVGYAFGDVRIDE